MSIRSLDEWAAARSQNLPLSSLKGAVLGIEARHYLDLHLNHYSTKEPLLIALGGFPFALKANIEKEIQALNDLDITCVFVFSGLDFGKKEHNFAAQNESSRALDQAWNFYDQQQADQVVDAFSAAGSAKPETLYRFLQRILAEQKVDFMVAPYSAAAQLAYLEKEPHRFIDAVFGSSELFLYDVDKIITKLELEPSQFSWVTRQACQNELGRLSNEQFVDFCLLLGSQYLRTFPPFENTYPGKGLNIRDALGMFNTAGRNVTSLCSQFEEDRSLQDLQYLDRYRRAFMTVKHHVILDIDGQASLLDSENATSDMHELIGQRLPEELYYYLSKGIIGAHIPNCVTSGELLITLPLGAEDSDIYRRLTGEFLMPIRTQSICLLTNSLHRFYQTKQISVRTWYDTKSDRTIRVKDLPSVKEAISTWRVTTADLPAGVLGLEARPGTFSFAVDAYKDREFISNSVAPRNPRLLQSRDEILQNVYWKFLQLRGYIDKQHQLTIWGQALQRTLSYLDPFEKLEETGFLAIELLRLGILNSTDWFSNISGGPMRGSDKDQTFNLMVSRVACIGKLRHKDIGYSGPLSRQLLSYRSLISVVRSTLRELMEVILVGMFLGGEAARGMPMPAGEHKDRNDYHMLASSLPFIDDNDCGLGIAVRTYLDDLPQNPDPTSPSVRAEAKEKGKEWFQHSESFGDNLGMAFRIWDAVYKGVQTAGKEAGDVKLWDEANEWLEGRK
ncbi:hypothetical protein FQN54_006320 [Arachnomyces sp. PD_36]|nr:hypothetical protein FQN54_006320 [Arachnomyces sp. PD_36]